MILPSLTHERSLWQKGYKLVAGIDEVGRGSWAGPLVVGAVIFPQNINIPTGLADSKLLTPEKRLSLSKIIKKIAIATAIAEISASRIDKISMSAATHEAFRKVTRILSPTPDFCLIDAFYIRRFDITRQNAIKNGDKVCASIAAASIIAKVYRDDLMGQFSNIYPNWGFERHKGYGTKFHQKAITKYGFSKIHRTSYNLSFLN